MLSEEAVVASRAAVVSALAGQPTAAVVVPSDAGTTHVSVVDRAGNACAFTASNGCHSGVIVPGTGLHLNNMMGEEDLAAGRHMPPGSRLTSMQAPSMATGDDGLELVIGSSGSNRLRSAITQVAVNVLDHHMEAQRRRRPPARPRRGRPARLRGRHRRGRAGGAGAVGRAPEPVRGAEPLLRRHEHRLGRATAAPRRRATRAATATGSSSTREPLKHLYRVPLFHRRFRLKHWHQAPVFQVSALGGATLPLPCARDWMRAAIAMFSSPRARSSTITMRRPCSVRSSRIRCFSAAGKSTRAAIA